MRTTLTLDEDVAARLRQLRRERDKPFKELVNEVLRAGLAHLEGPDAPARGPFTRVASLGRPRLPDVDDVTEAIAAAEGDRHR